MGTRSPPQMTTFRPRPGARSTFYFDITEWLRRKSGPFQKMISRLAAHESRAGQRTAAGHCEDSEEGAQAI